MRILLMTCVMALALGCRSVKPPDPSVSQEALTDLIDQADRLVVRDHLHDGNKVLYESRRRFDLEALKAATLVVIPDRRFHCRCGGSPVVSLYAGQKELGYITNHHGVTIRTSAWGSSNAHLANQQLFVQWFDDRGIPQVREEIEESERQRRQDALDMAKWKEAMPASLASLGEKAMVGYEPDVDTLVPALLSGYQSKSEAILSLLKWYGSGKGPWDRFSVYETVPEAMLFEFSTQEVVAAASARDLSLAEIEGLARLFCGSHSCRGKFRPDASAVPVALRNRMLEHCLSSGDDYKVKEAKHDLE